MGFLSPFMLWGALAAAIPLAIHLFFRSRYRTVPWAAMKFLLTSVEETSRRLKFQELLLLLLRMTVLAVLALAFARPISSVVRGGGRGDSVDAVFVIDVSFSMGANDGPRTRLERAREEAIKIVEELPAQSTVQIITCAGTNKTLLGPRSPGNLDQAKLLLEKLELTHLATDLYVGVAEAQSVLQRGQAANKELYVFSDMQKLGWDQQQGELKKTLLEIKDRAAIHLVRCGTRAVKNAAIVGITPQSGIPRPGERVGFAVLVRNTSAEALDNLTISLAVDGDEKNLESAPITRLLAGETRAVTLTGKLEKAGLRVLTARLKTDDLEGDNRFDQVILVRDHVNILVVDGNHHERDPEKSSSFYLMHTLLPVREPDRANYKFNPRVVPARLASPALLNNQDVCILVNVALPGKAGARAEVLPGDFTDALEGFVRKGHSMIVFSGDNVQPDAYNKVLGKRLGLLPFSLKPGIKATQNKPFLVDRKSFASGPPAFWVFKDDAYYKDFDKVEVWQHVEMEETIQANLKKSADAKEDTPVAVVARLNNGQALVAAKKVDSGEVLFVGTAAHHEGLDPKTAVPRWTDFGTAPEFLPFIDVVVNHLLRGQMQTYNLVAGQKLDWYPMDKQDNVYNLVAPDGKAERLGQPEKVGNRFLVTATDLPRAGIYHMVALPRGSESTETTASADAVKAGTPIAVVPDLRESEELQSLSDAQIDEQLGVPMIHMIAGESASVSIGGDRLNREWTIWVLMAVLLLVLGESSLAWWCGRAW